MIHFLIILVLVQVFVLNRWLRRNLKVLANPYSILTLVENMRLGTPVN